MDIGPTTTAGAAPRQGQAGAAPAQAGDAKQPAAPASDFQTFLQLLTAQMRNQDPLKPIESTEFVAQLASFSSVEQQVRSNDRLDKIVEALAGGSQAGLAAWIGRSVRAPADARFEGQPVEVAVTPDPAADRAVLVVRNAFDQEVARRSVPAGQDIVTWDGQNAMGATAPHGTYRFELESYAGEALLGSQRGSVFGEVAEVRLENGAPILVLAGGARVPLAEVTAVR